MLNIPYSRVIVDGKELSYVKKVLKSGWLTTASMTFEFENKFREIVEAKFACAVSSCTAALHLGLEALGVGEGDKVFVPSMTFTASAEVVRYLRADPVFLDVEYGTNLITPEILEEAIDRHPEVKTLMVVHYGGQGAQMLSDTQKSILKIIQRQGIRVIEDAAHAFPTRQKAKMVGSLGDVTCFSFYANKTITTGEGGMLTTNDEEIAKRVKVMQLHGIDRDVWNRYTSEKSSWEYDVIAPGYKYNMSDISAAIGLAQLEKALEMREQRERCARFYFEKLKDIDCLDLPLVHGNFKDHAWHLFVIVLNDGSPISRNHFIDLLAERGIGTSVHYKPLHRMSYYRERYQLTPENFPNTERMWLGCISIPIYPSLSNDELEYICINILDILT